MAVVTAVETAVAATKRFPHSYLPIRQQKSPATGFFAACKEVRVRLVIDERLYSCAETIRAATNCGIVPIRVRL